MKMNSKEEFRFRGITITINENRNEKDNNWKGEKSKRKHTQFRRTVSQQLMRECTTYWRYAHMIR